MSISPASPAATFSRAALDDVLAGNYGGTTKDASIYKVAGQMANRLAQANFFHERFDGGTLATDALRHLIGSALVVRDRGAGTAAVGGGLQEFVDTALGGDDRDRFMDSFNNQVGRTLYAELKASLGRVPSNPEIGQYMLEQGIDQKRAITRYDDPRLPARLNGR